MILTPVQRFVANLAAACGRRVSQEQSALYVDKLERQSLTDDQWSRVCSIMIDRGLEGMPQLPEIYSVIRHIQSATTVEQIPAWRTWRDKEGRTMAQKFGTQDATPGPQTLEQWKREACGKLEGRSAFREGFIKAGGNPAEVDGWQKALNAKDEPRRQSGRDRQVPEEAEVPF